MNLSTVCLHQKVIIADIRTDEKIKNRLISMGLEIGKEVSVVSKTVIGKNIIIEFGDEYQHSRVMINNREANLIFVKSYE